MFSLEIEVKKLQRALLREVRALTLRGEEEARSSSGGGAGTAFRPHAACAIRPLRERDAALHLFPGSFSLITTAGSMNHLRYRVTV